MSEEEQALMTIRAIDECRAARSELMSLRTKARSIGRSLERVGSVLQNAIPSRAMLNEGQLASLISRDEILDLIDEIETTHERVAFLEKELKSAGIIVPE